MVNQTNRELNVLGATAADSGKYYLQATNAHGSASTYEVTITVQDSGVLKWIKRLPFVESLNYTGGVSWNGNLHLVTAQGLWVSGKNVDSLVAKPLPGFKVLDGIRTHGSKLVIFGRDMQDNALAQNNQLMVSTDGISFSKITTNWASTQRLIDFASNGTVAVALVNGNIRYSSDLQTWTNATGITKAGYEGLEYSGGLFLAVRTTSSGVDSEALQWAVSSDGMQWTERSEAYGYFGRKSSLLTSANGKFFMHGYSPNIVSVTSDGATWTHGVTSFPEGSVALFDGTSYYNSTGGTSANGLSWNTDAFDSFSGLPNASDLIYHQGQFVRMGSKETRTAGFISQSPDFYQQPQAKKSPFTASGAMLQNLGNRLSFAAKNRIISNTFTSDGIHWEQQIFSERASAKIINPFRGSTNDGMLWLIGAYLTIDSNKLYKGKVASTVLDEVPLPSGTNQYTAFTAVTASGGKVVLADATRLWVSSNEGTSWALSSNVPGVSYYGHLHATPAGFLIVDGDSAWVSTNNAVSWQKKDLTILGRRGSNVIPKVSVLDSSVIALSQDGYLLTSANSGQTWQTHNMGESGWASAVQYDGKIYALHTDGRIGSSTTGTYFVFDSFLSRAGVGKDLEPFNGSLFALIGGGPYGDETAVYQAGAIKAEGFDLKVSGVSNELIYDIGQKIHLNWDANIQHGTLSEVTVAIDGVSANTTSSLQDGVTLTLPGEGRHVIDVSASTPDGVSVTQSFVVYSRGKPMKMITSNGKNAIKGTAFFAGTLYVAMQDGRLLRSGNGNEWELAMLLPAPPEVILSTQYVLIVASKQAIYSTQDGVSWRSRSTTGLWELADKTGASLTLSGMVRSDKVILRAIGGGSIFSSDGIQWDSVPIPSASPGEVEIFNDIWIGGPTVGGRTTYQRSLAGGARLNLSTPVGEGVKDVLGTAQGFLAVTASGLKLSTDGLTWQTIASAPTSPVSLSEVSGKYFLKAGVSSPYQNFTSVDLVNWSQVDRVPQIIEQGTWWNGDFSSMDGLTWSGAISTHLAYETIGFLGSRRIVRWKIDPGSTVEQLKIGYMDDLGEPIELNFTNIFLEPSPWGTSISYEDTSFFDAAGNLHVYKIIPGAYEHASRAPDGQWSARQTTTYRPRAYGNEKFFAFQLLNLKVSGDGVNWQNKPLTTSGSGDLGIKSLYFKDGAIYALTFKNIYRSSDDGDTWGLLYNGGYGNPIQMVKFNGALLLTTAMNGILPIIYNAANDKWNPLSSGITLNQVGIVQLAESNGFLFMIQKSRIYSTQNLLSWTTRDLPVNPYGASVKASFFADSQIALVFNYSSRVQTFTNDADGNWHERQEIGELQGLAGNGQKLVQHRQGQTWLESGRDIKLEIEAIRAPDVALNAPIEVDLALINDQQTAFNVQNSGRLRLWAVHDGVLNYQSRVLLSTLNLAGVTIPSGDRHSLTATVELPSSISAGNYSIVAELIDESSNTAFDDIARNNLAISSISLELAAHTLTVFTLGEGDVNRDNINLVYAKGARVSLTANVGKGSIFSGWGEDAHGSENQITLLMNSDKSVQANFSSYASLQVHVRGGGNVTGLSDLGSYALGLTASLTAQDTNGWEFSGWSGAATGSTATANITMDANKVVTATFIKSYSTWKSEHFTPENYTEAALNDPLITGEDADPDGDGLKNWQEYLHLSDPRDGASRGVKSMKVEGGYLYTVFTRNGGPSLGFSLSSQGSRDLSDWAAPGKEERVLSAENGMETIEARIPVAGKASGFLRFKYNRSAKPN